MKYLINIGSPDFWAFHCFFFFSVLRESLPISCFFFFLSFFPFYPLLALYFPSLHDLSLESLLVLETIFKLDSGVSRIERLELFDEFEEWHMMQASQLINLIFHICMFVWESKEKKRPKMIGLEYQRSPPYCIFFRMMWLDGSSW